MPATVALHDTTAEPDAIMLVGLNEPQIRPGGVVTLSVTVPANPLTATTVTVDVGDWPALTAAGDVADIVKSRNWKRAVTGWTREPLVPVMVRV